MLLPLLVCVLLKAPLPDLRFETFIRMPALETNAFAINIRKDILPLTLSDDGQVIYTRWAPGIFAYSISDAKPLFQEKVMIINRGKKPIVSATDSQFAHLEGYKFILAITGTKIAAPNAADVYCFIAIDKPQNLGGAEEFYLARVFPKKRGQHPNFEIRVPSALRRPNSLDVLPAYTKSGVLFFAANASSDPKKLKLQVFSWDGRSANLRPSKHSKLSGYKGGTDIGDFRLLTMDVPSGKLLYSGKSRIREYDGKSHSYVEVPLPFSTRSWPKVAYYGGRLILWNSDIKKLWELDRGRKSWRSIGNYEVVAVSAAQNWLMVRSGDGHIWLGR